MDHFSVVDMLHAKTYLREPVEYLVLREGPASLGLHATLQVTAITKVHNDAEFAALSFEDLDKGDNIGMTEGL